MRTEDCPLGLEPGKLLVSGFKRVMGPETRLQEVDELKGDEEVRGAHVDHILKQAS